MKTLIILILSSFTLFAQNDCVQLDVILVADLSGSVQGKEQFIEQALHSFVDKLELSEETIKVGLVIFNDYALLACPLTSNKVLISTMISNVNSADGNTNMKEAFAVASQELYSNRSRDGYKKAIVIISDGIVDGADETKQIGDQIKQFNIKVYGVLITESSDVGDEFMNYVSSPRCYVKSNYQQLNEEIKKLNICL